MMKNLQLAYLKEWVDIRTVRERILIVVVGCAFIYMAWHLIFTRSLVLHEKQLTSQILSLRDQIQVIKDKTKSVYEAGVQNAITQKLSQQKKLSGQSVNLKQRLDTAIQTVVKKDDIPKILKDVAAPYPGVTLQDLRVLSTESLLPANVDASILPTYSKMLYRKNFEMRFESSYFETINYLTHLETLPWHLYWDSLDYHVTTYPKGQVHIKFYVLVNQMG